MKKAQAILEMTVVFIMGLFLFFGIIGSWFWSNRQIALRQPGYNNSRLLAGTVVEPGIKPIVWPVYEAEELTEEDVFGFQR